ncbi:MAG: helix-turn-helix domain-containing protein [Phenylobacterium sp.]|uniref:helix-turn-helix domain-containing protein n=1 Tax=Phenylobacterium sp. TaxID=1871053 RepID=UPI00271FD28C|nr:helix-turn-helix domain-containing protein [Phenylobacterium sp.]MDO8900680.1 helix-turn-helix domain-containing protein [Phenylobacterium sp.]MDP2215324.1 helix-turn-helix domain-containing protein [Phenylobacterium sp.]
MALFFDAAWFDAQLAQRGLTRRVLAAAAGMSEADLALAYKDQRELSADEVGVFAELLGVSPAEIARQAGISTPIPGAGPEARIAALERRVAALEAELARLKS